MNAQLQTEVLNGPAPTAPFRLPIKPWQRIAASLFATGMPVYDIAVQVTQPVPDISAFLTSDPGRELINGILVENKARIDDLLEAAAVDSLMTLIRIRDTSNSEAARISASKEILSKTLPGVKARDLENKNKAKGHQSIEDEIATLKSKVTAI
jgi:hypothetical protein